jgi:hypothetical protein
MPTKKKTSGASTRKTASVKEKKPAVKKSPLKPLASKVSSAVSTPLVHGRTITHHRVVLHDTCKNCQSLPENSGTMITALALLIATLSVMVLVLATSASPWQDLATGTHSRVLSSDSLVRN